MKDIRLHKLTLNNFQGGNISVDFNGEDTDIFGANATGKTREFSAYMWLLFGKDALGRTDFAIKNLDENGEAEHGLDHSVEAEISIDNFRQSLKKVLSEKWVKQRGRAQAVFSGHTVNHFIDGVPVQEKEYKSHIAAIVGNEDIFKLVSSPTAYTALHWQKQRQTLLDICGDVTDADVIASDDTLLPLLTILNGKPVEIHKKVIAAKKAECNQSLEKIPVRIDEVRRSMPDVTGLKQTSLAVEATEVETLLNAKKLELQGVDTGGHMAELTKKLAMINAEIQKVQGEQAEVVRKAQSGRNQKIADAEAAVMKCKAQLAAINDQITLKSRNVESSDRQLETLRKQWAEIDAETFADTTAIVCATCGQDLPAEKVQSAREKAREFFNISKAERLTTITERGTNIRADRDKQSADIVLLQGEVRILTEKLKLAEGELKVFSEITIPEVPENPKYVTLLDAKKETEERIEAEKQDNAKDTEAIKREIDALQNKLYEAKGNLDKFTRREAGEKRIDVLMAEEKTLAAEFEKLEQELYLCEQFIKTKVSLLTDSINARFEFVRFKLFNTLVNGGIEPCCEITINGVPFDSGLNNAARIQAGCDVIRALQGYYDISAPVIIDNRESVTEIPDMNCQVISLIVSPEDKALRVEKVREREAAYA